jgi:hypothetical protein
MQRRQNKLGNQRHCAGQRRKRSSPIWHPDAPAAFACHLSHVGRTPVYLELRFLKGSIDPTVSKRKADGNRVRDAEIFSRRQNFSRRACQVNQ